jgi:hypothetical protein
MRSPLTLAVAALVLSLLSGCSALLPAPPETPETEDVVGAWVSAGPGGQSAVLTLLDDGTLTLEDAPANVFVASSDSAPDWTDLDSTTGTWEIGEVTGDGGLIPFLTGYLEPTETRDGNYLRLQLGGTADEPTLSTPIGDPDAGDYFTFERSTTQ